MPLNRNLNMKIVRLMTGFTNADSENHADQASLRDFYALKDQPGGARIMSSPE